MSSEEPRTGHVNVNGVQLAYLDWGGKGEPIVIVHATGFLGRIYRPIALALKQIGHVFSYDQRGHGDSGPAPDSRYDWYLTAADLAGFITAMNLGRVRAFGHSAGATAVGSVACQRPDLVARAVLAEPVIFTSRDAPELEWRNPFIELTLRRRRVFESVDTMFRKFEEKPPYNTWDREVLREYCEYGTRTAPDGRRELKCAPEVEARLYDTARDFDGLSRILRCEAPLLVIFGKRPDSLGRMLSARLAAEIKCGRVISVADGGHLLPMEKPTLIARMAVEFLASH